MTWHRAGFHGGPLVTLQDLPAKIQRARAATEASAIPLRPAGEAFESRLPMSVFTDQERDYLASGVPWDV